MPRDPGAAWATATVLVSNTVVVGLMMMFFATMGADTPVWLIVVQAFCSGLSPPCNTPA